LKLILSRGPNWIHGARNNPIADIGKWTNTIAHELDGSLSIIDTFGNRIDKKTTRAITNFLWATVEQAFAYSDSSSGIIPSSKSLFDYFKEEVRKTDLSQSEKEACLELSKSWGAYIGSSVDRQSLKFFFLEDGLEGGMSSGTVILAGENRARKLTVNSSQPVRGIDIPENSRIYIQACNRGC
jgi:hypothetical protein